MKKLTSLGIGMGLVLACTVGPVSAQYSPYTYPGQAAVIGAFGLAGKALNGYTPVTIPGYTPRPVSPPSKVPSVPDIHNGLRYPVRVGGPDAKPPLYNHLLDIPSG
jgi:hypothetical protein